MIVIRVVVAICSVSSALLAADTPSLPQLPIPLTPEEDDLLVSQGVLPSKATTNVVHKESREVAVVQYGTQQTNSAVGRTNDGSRAGSDVGFTYEERRRLRMAAAGAQTNTAPIPKYDGKELGKHLSELKLEVIRSGLPPLPIPLTEEEVNILKREGAESQQK